LNLLWKILLILLVIYFIRQFLIYNRKLSNYVRNEVFIYFENLGFTVKSIENAHKDHESPFYGKYNLAPSTGSEGPDLFKHRFYKVTLIKNDEMIKWVDCLYFLKFKCWFIIKDYSK